MVCCLVPFEPAASVRSWIEFPAGSSCSYVLHGRVGNVYQLDGTTSSLHRHSQHGLTPASDNWIPKSSLGNSISPQTYHCSSSAGSGSTLIMSSILRMVRAASVANCSILTLFIVGSSTPFLALLHGAPVSRSSPHCTTIKQHEQYKFSFQCQVIQLLPFQHVFTDVRQSICSFASLFPFMWHVNSIMNPKHVGMHCWSCPKDSLPRSAGTNGLSRTARIQTTHIDTGRACSNLEGLTINMMSSVCSFEDKTKGVLMQQRQAQTGRAQNRAPNKLEA